MIKFNKSIKKELGPLLERMNNAASELIFSELMTKEGWRSKAKNLLKNPIDLFKSLSYDVTLISSVILILAFTAAWNTKFMS